MSQSVAQLIEAVWSTRSVGALLLDASFKATVVLAAAGLAVLLVRKGSASGRHLVWSLAVLAALCLPLFGLVLPSWRVEVVESAGAATPALRTEGPFATGAKLRTRTPWRRRPAATTGSGRSASGATRSAARGERLPLLARPGLRHLHGPRARPLPPAELDGEGGVAVLSLLCALWATGAALLLARLVHGGLVASLARRAHRVLDGRRTLARQLCAALGVRRPVRLLESNEPVLPMTWGVLQPTVLLPDSSRAWSEERLQLVLLHELAHVRRLDALTQLARSWPARSTGFTRWCGWRPAGCAPVEYACDDHVLSAGRPPPSTRASLGHGARAGSPDPARRRNPSHGAAQ